MPPDTKIWTDFLKQAPLAVICLVTISFIVWLFLKYLKGSQERGHQVAKELGKDHKEVAAHLIEQSKQSNQLLSQSLDRLAASQDRNTEATNRLSVVVKEYLIRAEKHP